MKLRQKSRRVAGLLVLVLILGLSACGSRVDIPFNGEVSFHEITVTIPRSFIRDSTQSSEDLWVFEKGFYSQLILLSRSTPQGDAIASLDSYAAYLTGEGAGTQRGTFMGMEAVLSAWTRDGTFCQELMFAYNGSLYAVSLRGGSEEEFQALLDTVTVPIS